MTSKATVERPYGILMLSYFYPPDGASGSIRNGFYIHSLATEVRRLDVITGHPEATVISNHEPVPPALKVIRSGEFFPVEALIRLRDKFRGSSVAVDTSAAAASVPDENPHKNTLQRVKDFITDSLSTPDKEVFWFFTGLWCIFRRCRADNYDLIYAVGKPWTAMLMGVVLKKLWRKPLVIDFMDPWISNPYGDPKARILERLERWLEHVAIRNADLLVANTPTLERDFAERYGNEISQSCVVTCGYMPDSQAASAVAASRQADAPLVICHIGTLYARRDPSQFMLALLQLINSDEVDPKRIRLQLVGQLDIRSRQLSEAVDALTACGALEMRTWVPHNEAMEILRASDVALIIQPETLLQIPAKLYEYVALEKPILAVAEDEGAVAAIIRTHRWGAVVSDDRTLISAQILAWYDLHARGEALAQYDEPGKLAYSYPQIARHALTEIETMMDRVKA